MPSARPVRSDLLPRRPDVVTILALDGGGMRGIIPARLLEWLEQRLGGPIHRFFDLVAGTSTGGILALGLTAAGDDRKKPRYAASQLLELYRRRGRDIFGRSLLHDLTALWGLRRPKYPASNIEPVLRESFGSRRLSEALTPVLVTSYDTAAAAPYLFKSYRQPAPGAAGIPDDYLVWQAARATSAAPTFFPPLELARLESGDPRCLVDGGVYANNPAMCALADASKLFGPGAEYLVVSIGTGNDELTLGYADAARRGLAGWALPILKIVFDGVSDTVDYQVEELADRYWRFQDERVVQELDDASQEAVARLLEAADDLVARREADLEAVARALEENLAGTARDRPTA